MTETVLRGMVLQRPCVILQAGVPPVGALRADQRQKNG